MVNMACGCADQLPEADMIMGFENYSTLPRHLRGMLGMSPEMDPATHSGRTQVGLDAALFGLKCKISTFEILETWSCTHCFTCLTQEAFRFR